MREKVRTDDREDKRERRKDTREKGYRQQDLGHAVYLGST